MDEFLQETEEFLAYQQPEDPCVLKQRLKDAAMPIVARMCKDANDAVSKRKEVEQRWLEDMCQYQGVRSVYTETKPEGRSTSTDETKGSQVFVNITRPKTNRTEGRLCDILFPADDKNWGIEPTPVPELATIARRAQEESKSAIERANALAEGPEETTPDGMTEEQLVEMAGDLGPQAAEANRIMEEAKKRSQRMADEIDDQFVESQYAQKSRDAIGWACKIGVGILKGPVVLDRQPRKWQETENGYSLETVNSTARPAVECVSPWAFFPDPNASSMEDAEYVFERHIASRKDLRRMARNLRFDEDATRELLEEGPDFGSNSDLQFLTDMRSLTGETTPVNDRYIIWEYHGFLTVEEIVKLLRSMGSEERAEQFEAEYDPLEEHTVIAFFCNNKLLKLSEYYPMDSGEMCYSVYSLEKGSASILGAIGVPRMMKDSQEALNAAWRMQMDNGALSVGPQVLVDKGSVRPEDGSWDMYPGKVWLWDSANATGDPFKPFNIPCNQAEIAGIITLAMQFIDEETMMPRVAEGGGSMENMPGVTSTVGGFAMLLNAAGVNIRRMVKNWDDDVTSPIVRRFYDWNMQYSEKDEIKGDMTVEARGTSVLLTRETMAQNLAALTQQWTVHPVLGPMLKPWELGRHTLQSLAINPADILISQEEYEERMKAAAQPEESPEDPQWQVRLQIAQIDADARLKVAEMQREEAILKLSESSQLSIEKIKADLQKTKMTNESRERQQAADIGIERERQAAAPQLPPQEVVGVGVG